MRVALLAAIVICVAAGSAGAQPSKMNPLSSGVDAASAAGLQPVPASLTVEVPVLEVIQVGNARVSALEPQARVAIMKVKAPRVEPIRGVNVELAKIELDRAASRPITGADVTVVRPSEIESFNTAAVNALLASSPTEPLPKEYPDDKAFFTVTFFFNESPEGQGAPAP